MRATSSIRSASIAMSKRHDGGCTLQPAPCSGVRCDRHAECCAAAARPRAARDARARAAAAAAAARSITAGTRGSSRGQLGECAAAPARRRRSAAMQRGGALERALLPAPVHAALEALAGIGLQPVAARAAGDRRGREPGRPRARRRACRGSIAVRAPPMTPASPTARLLVGDHQHVVGRASSSRPSSSRSRSPARARRADRPPCSLRRS